MGDCWQAASLWGHPTGPQPWSLSPLQAGEGLGAKESGVEGAGGTPVAARYPKLVLGCP